MYIYLYIAQNYNDMYEKSTKLRVIAIYIYTHIQPYYFRYRIIEFGGHSTIRFVICSQYTPW